MPIPESGTRETPGDLKSLQQAALKQLASAHQGSRAELARKLGISERSLYRKLKTLDF
jgi:DNA-binding NtrC family response regulator